MYWSNLVDEKFLSKIYTKLLTKILIKLIYNDKPRLGINTQLKIQTQILQKLKNVKIL